MEGGPLAKNDRSPGRESTQRLCTCLSPRKREKEIVRMYYKDKNLA